MAFTEFHHVFISTPPLSWLQSAQHFRLWLNMYHLGCIQYNYLAICQIWQVNRCCFWRTRVALPMHAVILNTDTTTWIPGLPLWRTTGRRRVRSTPWRGRRSRSTQPSSDGDFSFLSDKGWSLSVSGSVSDSARCFIVIFVQPEAHRVASPRKTSQWRTCQPDGVESCSFRTSSSES